jgi:hypothetical protein
MVWGIFVGDRCHHAFAELIGKAINHKFMDLPIKIQTNHAKTPLIFKVKKYPIDQECS